jgi:hypothetical protein
MLAISIAFLCHVQNGPWTAVHGPATVFASRRNGVVLLFVIALAAHSVAEFVRHLAISPNESLANLSLVVPPPGETLLSLCTPLLI